MRAQFTHNVVLPSEARDLAIEVAGIKRLPRDQSSVVRSFAVGAVRDDSEDDLHTCGATPELHSSYERQED